eukprot:12274104-Ditylum_brightwellii.AAC.1
MSLVGGGRLAATTMAVAATMAAAASDGGNGVEMHIFHHYCQIDKPVIPPFPPFLTFIICSLKGKEGGVLMMRVHFGVSRPP